VNGTSMRRSLSEGSAGLFAILTIGTILRFSALAKGFYVDEISTLTVASQPLAAMGETMREIDASPALFPLLLHGWLLLGSADVWVRLLPALFGIGAIGVVYSLGRLLYGPRAALAGAFLMAVAPIHVEYAAYVRAYSLFTLLALCQLTAFYRCIATATQPVPLRRLAVFTALTAALFYTHYLSLLLLAAEGLFSVATLYRTPRTLVRLGVSVVVAGLLFLPGADLLRHNVTFDAQRNAERAEAPPWYRITPDVAGELLFGRRDLGFSSPGVRRTVTVATWVVFAGLLGAGVLAGWRANRQGTMLLLVMAVLPILFYVVSGRKLIAVRFFLPSGAFLLMLAAAGLASLRHWLAAAAIAGAAILAAVPVIHFASRFEWTYDHRAVAAAIETRWHPGDIILFVHPYEALHYRWYLGPDLPLRGLTFTALTEQDTYVIKPPPLSVPVAQQRVRAAASEHRRFWVIGQSARSFSVRDTAEETTLFGWLDGEFEKDQDLTGLVGPDPVVRLYRSRKPALPRPERHR
jgi:hypothetical protein